MKRGRLFTEGFFFFLKGVALLLRNVLAAAPFLPRSFLFALA